jgi:outer membrane protein TolC
MNKIKRTVFGGLLFFLIVFFCFDVFGMAFSYEQALEMALRNTFTIQEIQGQIEKHEEEIRNISRETDWSLDTGNVIRRQRTDIERQIRYLRLNLEIIRANTEQSLRNALVNIAVTENHIRIAEARLVISEEHLRRTTVLHRFGLRSTRELSAAEQSLTQQRMDLDNQRLTSLNQLQVLNNLIQQPHYQLTAVEFEVEPAALPEDLDQYILTFIPQAPAIRQMQITIDRRRDERDHFAYQHRDLGYWLRGQWRLPTDELQNAWDHLVNAHERAVRERETAKRVMEANIRAAYNNALRLLAQEAAGLAALELAVNELDSTQRQLTLGRVTPFEVENALLAILERELSLQNIRYQLWLIVW